MSLYKILKSFSETFLLILVGLGSAQAQFKSPKDREIVSDILKSFARGCPFKVANQSQVVDALRSNLDRVRAQKNQSIQACYEENYSQILGVSYVYKRLCDDLGLAVSKELKMTDNAMARQILVISKYENGIRPYHSVLNDCLLSVPNREGKMFIVPISGNELKIDELKAEVDRLEARDVYPPTGEPFR